MTNGALTAPGLSRSVALSTLLARSGSESNIYVAYMRTIARMYPDLVQGNEDDIPGWAIRLIRDWNPEAQHVFDSGRMQVSYVTPISRSGQFQVATVCNCDGKVSRTPISSTTEDAKAAISIYRRVQLFVENPRQTYLAYIAAHASRTSYNTLIASRRFESLIEITWDELRSLIQYSGDQPPIKEHEALIDCVSQLPREHVDKVWRTFDQLSPAAA